MSPSTDMPLEWARACQQHATAVSAVGFKGCAGPRRSPPHLLLPCRVATGRAQAGSLLRPLLGGSRGCCRGTAVAAAAPHPAKHAHKRVAMFFSISHACMLLLSLCLDASCSAQPPGTSVQTVVWYVLVVIPLLGREEGGYAHPPRELTALRARK